MKITVPMPGRSPLQGATLPATACLLLAVATLVHASAAVPAVPVPGAAPVRSARPEARSAVSPVMLMSITPRAVSNTSAQVTLRFSGPAPTAKFFVMSHPFRLVVDLPNTLLALASSSLTPHVGGIESIVAVHSGERTRLVFTLAQPMTYAISRRGEEERITLNAAAPRARVPPRVPAVPSPYVPASPLRLRSHTAFRPSERAGSRNPGKRLKLVGTARSSAPSAAIAAHTSSAPINADTLAAASAEWGAAGIAPALLGGDGEVLYAYGENRPTVTCAPLRLCVINLIPGDRIVNIAIGDSVRWLAQSIHAGKQDSVVLKPVEAGLTTNLMIAAESAHGKGHLYYLTLVSDSKGYIPMVGFYNPNSPQSGALSPNVASPPPRAGRSPGAAAMSSAPAVAEPGAIRQRVARMNPTQIDFGYVCHPDGHFWQGSQRRRARAFLPERVFAYQGHTYVQMPPGIGYHDLPAIFGLEGKTYLLNSRFKNGYYIVDSLPAQLRLIDGVGSNSASVTCRHTNR